MKVLSRYSFIQQIHLAVFLPMILLTILSFLIYTISGLEASYQAKCDEVSRLSKMLAINAASPQGSGMVATQVNEILKTDKAINDIVFYSIENNIDLTHSRLPIFLTVMTQDSINIQEPVLSTTLSNIITGNMALSENATKNQPLLGYINTTIDLNQLRIEWFAHHKYFLLGIVLSYLLLNWIIYQRTLNPLSELKNFADTSSSVVENEDDTYYLLLNKELRYKELACIQQLIRNTHERYLKCMEEHQLLKQRLEGSEYSHVISVQHSSFQSMITHELKTSLNSIFGGLQLLDNHYMSSEQQDAVNVIRKGSTELEVTLNQIIQLNRIEKGQMSVAFNEFQPLQLINEIVNKYQAVATAKGIKLISHINHVDCILQGDDLKIGSIIDMLLDNAIKFTQEGQVVVESDLLYFKDSIRWTVAVTDTGIGIEEKYLEDIFSPFFQVDPSIDSGFEGVGVGLGLAKKLTQLLKGQLLVESKRGEGSQFSLAIQLKNNKQVQDQSLLKGVRVVYLTDIQHGEFSEALISYGAEVVTAGSSEDVLEYLKHEQINILLITKETEQDKVIELAQKIRETEVFNHLLIVYYQYSLQPTEIDRLQAAGVDFCEPVNKSYIKQALLIKSWLAL